MCVHREHSGRYNQRGRCGETRVSFETNFDSKQPKLVSALSEIKRLFRLFRFFTQTETFDVLIEPKKTEDYFVIFYRKFGGFPVFSFIFGFFRFVSKQFVSVVSLLYRNREFRCLN
jgi:hypothetical protein